MIRTIVLTSVALLALLPGLAPGQQVLIFWDAEQGDWNDSSNWFEEFGPPDAEIGDVGVVSNDGLAFLDSKVTFPAGGVILGERGGEQGTLHLRSGGELSAIEEFDVSGGVVVGQAGQGTLIVDRGGSLTAESLRSGGHADSAIVLGGGDSGNASVQINGAAALGRHTRIVGPNVSFEAESLSLSGTLTAEIQGESHSTLDISGSASLGGTLDLQFAAPFVPTPGQTWNLIDAASIAGQFSDISSNVSPGPGLAFTLSNVAGGDNGTLAQVGIDARLQLTVDRRTGATQIQNLAEAESITINGYGVAAASGLLSSDNWNRLGDDWRGNGSSTHVAEVNLAGSSELGPGANVNLGNVYAFQGSELGESNEDVIFEYHVADGEVVSGLIEFTGAHNDVVLVVAEDGAYIQNQSTRDVTINGYAILSEGGGLDPADWTSLSGTDNAWTEANAGNNHITELNLGGSLTLAATSDAIPLGPIISDGADDLVFVINRADSGPHTATVEYNDGVLSFGGGLLGDCNGDGGLNADDLNCVGNLDERNAVLAALNTLAGDLDGDGEVGFPDFLTLSANFGQPGLSYSEGNIDLVDTVGFPDFLELSANFGQTPAATAAVPEPSGLGGTLVAAFLFCASRRRRR